MTRLYNETDDHDDKDDAENDEDNANITMTMLMLMMVLVTVMVMVMVTMMMIMTMKIYHLRTIMQYTINNGTTITLYFSKFLLIMAIECTALYITLATHKQCIIKLLQSI